MNILLKKEKNNKKSNEIQNFPEVNRLTINIYHIPEKYVIHFNANEILIR